MATPRVYDPQNANVWRAIREPMNIAPAPAALEMDLGQIIPTYDLAQGGWLDPQVYTFQSAAISINGATGEFIVGTTAPTNSYGTVPTVEHFRRIDSIAVNISGGATTPISMWVRLRRAGTDMSIYRQSGIVNPSQFTIPGPILAPGGQEVDIVFRFGPGGVGDTFTMESQIVYGLPGVQLTSN